ncbi:MULTISPECIES: hypothetical protein [Lysobacter]|jgi:hypothetical protein|uniref:Uncharacterized protein n=1 Tax=Lysobacter gummosus TaxID=262324 RepID=A0ABY3X655_9GAMM|nr:MULTISPECIES: hypothetical protein [Lysobacter]ALN92474.1 hypothetical protein LG3211_3529 [Lysobacter gummosus]UJB20635.1 hypothetical protein L1A79_06055 [Lysobacter capsici]UJQ30251.1 hypothetical protein L2D09_08805 [Lysobacter gummosus]UNP28051.1 hypothetical protein MOV92_16285 [Lysobacter gummosus]
MTPTPLEKTGEFERTDNGWVLKFWTREDAGLRLHHEVFDDTPALLRRIYELFGRGDARPVAASPRIAA